MKKQFIEIPFGAKDSELCGWKYTIPEGMEATIVGNKIVVKKKVSENERIRKEMIDAIQGLWDNDALPMPLSVKRKDSWIAWLEKQGEKDSQITLPQFTFDDILALQCCMETVNKVQEDKDLYKKLEDLHSRVYDAYHLEKQGKQKASYTTLMETGNSGINALVTKELPTNSCDAEKKELKKIEQKPTWSEEDEKMLQGIIDEIEANKNHAPDYNIATYDKFLKGEWLCENEPNNYARFIQILEIVNVQGKIRYKISRDIHNDKDIVDYRFIKNNYHSFTIQDAKDGDVLVMQKTNITYESIFIFNKIENNRIIQYLHYFTTDVGEEVCEARSIDGFLGFVGTTVHPATKEQRNLLFQKMKEAGYEWGAEKKELKKIEQEPAWSEEDEKTWKELIKEMKDQIDSIPVPDCRYKEDEVLKQLNKWLTWLKSLKDRHTWKPSEEMLEALYRAIPENVMAISEDEMLLDKLYQGLKYGRVLSKN